MSNPSRPDETVEHDWLAARFFITKGPSATLQFLKEEPRTWLRAYEAQATEGPCTDVNKVDPPVEDLSRRRVREAWRKLGGMDQIQAKEKFVALLTNVLPSWRDWYKENVKIHKLDARMSSFQVKKGEDQTTNIDAPSKHPGACSSHAHLDEGEAMRLLKAFQEKTGFVVRAKL